MGADLSLESLSKKQRKGNFESRGEKRERSFRARAFTFIKYGVLYTLYELQRFITVTVCLNSWKKKYIEVFGFTFTIQTNVNPLRNFPTCLVVLQ